MNKKQLRAQFKWNRSIFVHDTATLLLTQYHSNIEKAVLEVFKARAVHSVGCYWPHNCEVDTKPLMQTLDILGVRVGLPRINSANGMLHFHPWKEGDELVVNQYGIPEPREHLPELIPDVLVVPLVAFDVFGYRLGCGGGYYDRFIHRLRVESKLLTIGLAYSIQLMDKLPIDSHDEILDYVVTEEKVWSFNQI